MDIAVLWTMQFDIIPYDFFNFYSLQNLLGHPKATIICNASPHICFRLPEDCRDDDPMIRGLALRSLCRSVSGGSWSGLWSKRDTFKENP